MRRTRRNTQQLMHWSKNGDLVMKNKIKDAILRENLHEERSLDSTLTNINKHQNEEAKHLVNKRIQFAKRRQRSMGKNELQHHFLERQRSYSDGALHLKDSQKSHKASFNAKVKWQKAISVVRFAVQSKSGKRNTRLGQTELSFFPRIAIQSSPKASPKLRRSNVSDNKQLVLPQISSRRVGHKNCLDDPRFLRLQQILSLGDNKSEDGVRKSQNKNGGQVDKDGRLRSQTFHL